ncbi:hypothetical protein Tco_1230271 [Tanacetum coccineum]
MEGLIEEDNDDESRYKQRRRWNMYTNYDDVYEINHDVAEKEELYEIHELSVCNIRRFEMIKYSFGQDEVYVAIKEDKYDDLARTSEDACRAYQEIFRMVDEGWMLIRGGSEQSHVSIPSLRVLIMEYLVNISKRHTFWSLNEYILIINDSDYQYAVSIKEDTTYPCLHSPKTMKETSSIRRIQRRPIRHIEDIICEDSGRYQAWSLLQETPNTPDVEEDGDLSLEARKDEEVALVDGVFEGGMMLIFGLLDGLEVEALVDAIEVMVVDDK